MKDVFKIKLCVDEIEDFVCEANKIPNDINLFQDNNHVVVSGKSIVGIYALDLGNTINMIVRDRTTDDTVKKVFKRWIVE